MIIDILCPTRGRPHLAKRMLDSLYKTVSDPSRVRLWVYLSDNDQCLDGYYFAYSLNPILVNAIKGKDAPTAWMWNYLAEKAHNSGGDLFFLIGDDVIFETEGWDEIYRESSAKNPDGIFVLAPDDGRGSGVPHPCVSRAWIDTLGYFVNPAFLHWGVDSYTEHLALSVDRLIRLPDVKITHQKVGEANPVDETYKRLREGVWNARDLEVLDLMKNRYAGKDIELLKGVVGGT